MTRQSFSITPLSGCQRDGSNAFTYSRFLVPYLCDFQGTAIFLDGSDMLMRSDVSELAALADPQFAVQVVQHSYRPLHTRKYIGTTMEAPNAEYPRKNWSSVILWNCEHHSNRWLTPEAVQTATGPALHRFSWLPPNQIGALPSDWNHIVGEPQYAKIAHFTLGIPSIPHYQDCAYAEEWRRMQALALQSPLERTE